MSEQKMGVVERLLGYEQHVDFLGSLLVSTMKEAAAELEQLRAELAGLKKAQGEPVEFLQMKQYENSYVVCLKTGVRVISHSFWNRDEAEEVAQELNELKLYTAPQPAAAIDELNERAAFERPYIEGDQADLLSWNGYGYSDPCIDDLWRGWSMRAKLNAQPAVPFIVTAPTPVVCSDGYIDYPRSGDWRKALQPAIDAGVIAFAAAPEQPK